MPASAIIRFRRKGDRPIDYKDDQAGSNDAWSRTPERDCDSQRRNAFSQEIRPNLANARETDAKLTSPIFEYQPQVDINPERNIRYKNATDGGEYNKHKSPSCSSSRPVYAYQAKDGRKCLDGPEADQKVSFASATSPRELHSTFSTPGAKEMLVREIGKCHDQADYPYGLSTSPPPSSSRFRAHALQEDHDYSMESRLPTKPIKVYPSSLQPSNREPITPRCYLTPPPAHDSSFRPPSPGVGLYLSPSPSRVTRESMHLPIRAKYRSTPHIPRPPNSFMIYRSHFWDRYKQTHAERDLAKVSCLAGASWRSLSPSEKAYWQYLAAKAKNEHAAKYPDYKYRYQLRRSASVDNPWSTDPSASLRFTSDSR
ncbi:slightly ste11-like protein [Marasmius crinis-equi]|uniref:Slightly ste11-like protein n=1 Tax=Marasmius crinis-equi TaxID=585013 RepID=A0ABR3ES80_9AGAR